jgi:hypothetical protein
VRIGRSYSILGLFLLLAVIFRIAVALYLGNIVDAPPLLTDQRSYDALGARLITGHGFSFDRGWYPFTLPDKPTAHWSFLYSLFVAAVYAVAGTQPLAVRLVQATIGGVLLPWMAFRLSRRLLTGPTEHSHPAKSGTLEVNRPSLSRAEAISLIAAGLAAVYAYFVLYAATLMTETFYIGALLWSLERALVVRERLAERQNVSVGLALTLGLSLGIAMLLRQSILPWIVVLFVWLSWVGHRMGQTKGAIKTLVLAVVPIVVLVLPFTIRNYRVYGSFLLLNSNAGYAMYSAQHPMHGTEFQEFAAAPLPEELWGQNEAALDRELMRSGIGFVMADPQRYLLLCLSRVRAYFDARPSAATSSTNALGRLFSFGIFVPFMLFGLWLALRDARRSALTLANFLTTPLALILLFAVVYSLLHILTWAMPRYRLPVDAVLLPFAALALYDLAGRTRWGRRLLAI